MTNFTALAHPPKDANAIVTQYSAYPLEDLGLLKYFKYVFVLAVLEGRHLAYNWGGKTAVSVLTTAMGAIAGGWFATKGLPFPTQSANKEGGT